MQPSPPPPPPPSAPTIQFAAVRPGMRCCWNCACAGSMLLHMDGETAVVQYKSLGDTRSCFGGCLCPRITRRSTGSALCVCGRWFAEGACFGTGGWRRGDQQLFWFLCFVTGEPLATLEGHTAEVTSASFSPDGSRIVSSSRDRTVRVWNANSGMRRSWAVAPTRTVTIH